MQVSEIFYSIQGEGLYTGCPMIFVRLFGCNMQCAGFSNPSNQPVSVDSETGLTSVGCDSRYSWDPLLKGTKRKLSNVALLKEVMSLIPEPVNQPILCFTGGEPLLQQHAIRNLLEYIATEQPGLFSHILVETNGSIELTEPLIRKSCQGAFQKLTWSISPKLSNSGEPKEKAINPKAVVSLFSGLNLWIGPEIEAYLKYVSDGTAKSADEIYFTTIAYISHIRSTTQSNNDLLSVRGVYVMAEGATKEQQEKNMPAVVALCLKYDFRFCARVHTWIWGNQKGT